LGNHSARGDDGLSGALRGFYAILDRDDPALAETLVSPDGAGARILQIRLKPASSAAILAAARAALPICRRHGALLIVNDRLDLALAAGADGVHLGQDDVPISAIRGLGEPGRFVIGVSTHDEAQVREAVAAGADYLGFGPVFETGTKANPDPVQGIGGLRRAVAVAGRVPVVAIGGISPENVGAVRAAGAAAACAIAAVTGAPDPAYAGRLIGAPWAAAAREAREP
jgi:thiamine-phosphate pyrophosphorylase